MMKRRSVLFLAGGALVGVVLAVGAIVAVGAPETQLPWSVFGAGGTTSSSTNFRAGFTTGQTAIGASNSSNFGAQLGFWYGVDCTPGIDVDGDTYVNSLECHVGTSAILACSADTIANNEEPDARPTDFNDDRAVTGADLSAVAGVIGQLVPPAPLRRDIAPDPVGDNAITGADLSRVAGVIGSSC